MKKTLIVLLMAMGIANVNAQNILPDVIASSGASHQGTTVQVDWTLGELAITTIQNTSHQITQGFHQPNYLITSIDALPPEIEIIGVNVFPNPTTDNLVIELGFDQEQAVNIRLIDVNGRIMETYKGKGITIKGNIEMRHLPNGNYFLHFVIDDNSFSQTFKIQKIN